MQTAAVLTRRRSRLGWLTFGKLVPSATFAVLAAANLQLVIGDGTGQASFTATRVTLLVGRILAMCIPLSMLLAYLIRQPAQRSDRAPVAAALGITGAAMPIAVPVAQKLLALPAGAAAEWQLLGANLLLCASSVLALWALSSLKTSFSIIPEARTLRTAGPYALVRHPLYMAEISALGGTALMLGALWVWGAVVVFAGVQYLRATREERVLAVTFEDYTDYQARTGKIFPRLAR